MKTTSVLAAVAAAALGACAPSETPSPAAAIMPPPTETYVCGDKKLAVKLLGAAAEVSIDGAEAVSLPVLGDAGDTFTNGRLTLFVKQGKVSYAVGRMAAVECAAG